MFTVQLPPTAMLPPQLLPEDVVKVKSPGLLPPKAIELMLRAAVAVGRPAQIPALGPLQMVTVWTPLFVPAACVPKVRPVGTRVTMGAAVTVCDVVTQLALKFAV